MERTGICLPTNSYIFQLDSEMEKYSVQFIDDGIQWLATEPRIRASNINICVGDIVECRYSDGKFYPAVVLKIPGNAFLVSLHDYVLFRGVLPYAEAHNTKRVYGYHNSVYVCNFLT